MARTVRDTRLETRSARLKLKARRDPYWKGIQKGLVVGYRKGAKGGTWIARAFESSVGRRFEPLGVADDIVDADGVRTLSFDQAQERARSWLAQLALADAGQGPRRLLIVQDAAEDYFADFRARGRAIDEFRRIIDRDIVPALGTIEVAKLTTRRIRDWHQNLAFAPVPLRAKQGEKPKARKPHFDPAEALRRRKVTANHKLTVLKALLNHAFRENQVASDIAWRKVRPFPRVDVAIVRFLSEEEVLRLLNVTGAAFQRLIYAAIMTGCRYQELAGIRCGDYSRAAKKVFVRNGKGGKARHVRLSDEGLGVFDAVTLGRPRESLAFCRSDGSAWGKNHQQRLMREASSRAGIDPPAHFHLLRHSHASWLAMRRVSLGVIASQLGHSDTRITEKHYAHLAQSYVDEEIRSNLPRLGFSLANDAPVLDLKAGGPENSGPGK